MQEPETHLAHAMLQVINFSARQLSPTAAFLFPRASRCTTEVLTRIASGLEYKTDSVYEGLGDIFVTAVASTLNAVAYDANFSIVAWIEQFAKSYTPGPDLRVRFLGGHPVRLLHFTRFAHVTLASGGTITLDQVDRIALDVIRLELSVIYSALTTVAVQLPRAEDINLHILKERRVEVFTV